MEACKRTTILLLGITGSGKSTLGNAILNERCFETSSFASACTNDTELKLKVDNGLEINVIDTPGFEDTEGNDKNNLEKMVQFLKGHKKGVNLIVFVINSNDYRLTKYYKITIGIIHQIFQQKTSDFVNHLCIAYTHCENSNEKISRLSQFTNKFETELKKITGIQTISIPTYFVDCKENANKDLELNNYTRSQIQQMIIKSLQYLSLPTSSVQQVDPNIKSKSLETMGHIFLNETTENNITSTTHVDKERHKIQYWNGMTGHNDWTISKYIITQRRKRKQRVSFFMNHYKHSWRGISRKRHYHYKHYIRTFIDERIVTKNRYKKIISETPWKMIESSFKESLESDGHKRGTIEGAPFQKYGEAIIVDIN